MTKQNRNGITYICLHVNHHKKVYLIGLTKSGKPSTQGSKATGERYLPASAIKALSSSEYAATTAAKRAGTRAGKQHVKQPKSISKKTAKFRQGA